MESESRGGSANHAKIMGTEKKATEGSQAVTKTLLPLTHKGTHVIIACLIIRTAFYQREQNNERMGRSFVILPAFMMP